MSRNLFDELNEGLDALADVRQGKITLKQHAVKEKPVPIVTAEQVASLRRQLRLSRAVFAHYLRTKKRTLESWEQGRARPNAQAALLIKMVEHYPDTVERLANL